MAKIFKTSSLIIVALMLSLSARAQQVVQNRTYESGEKEQRNTSGSISTADNVAVKSGADVQWESLTQIHLTPGFHAQPGAYFDAVVPDPNAFVLVALDGDNQSASPGAVNARPFDIAAWQHNAPVVNWPITFTVKSGGGLVMSSAGGSGGSSLTLQSDIDGTVRAYFKQPSVANTTSVIQVTSNGKTLQLLSYNFDTPLAGGNGSGNGGNGSGSSGAGDPNAPGNSNGNAPNWNLSKEDDNAAGFAVFSPAGDSVSTFATGPTQPSVLLTPAMTDNNAPAPFSITTTSVYSTVEGRGFYAFNHSYADSGWITASNSFAAPNYTGSHSLTIYLGASRTLTNYKLFSRGNSGAYDYDQFPSDWQVSVSNDGVNFEVVDTRTGVPLPTALKQEYAYTLQTPKSGSYVRITVTRARRDLSTIGEIELYGY